MPRSKSLIILLVLIFALQAFAKQRMSSTRHKRLMADRARKVVHAFRVSWKGYLKYAFPHDELHPVSNGFGDSRNGWGASAVDALSTALIMGEKHTVNQIISYIPSIDWSKGSCDISLFETTIRYLGGMLSAYDLLRGPLAHLAKNKANVHALLTQSIHLANNLSYAFETPSGVPYKNLCFSDRSHKNEPIGLAAAGSLILEWTRLADLSGNKTCAHLVSKAQSYLLHPSPSSTEPFPGLLGSLIDVPTGKFINSLGGWVAGEDSFYEYLIKMWIYDPRRFHKEKDRWIAAADSTIRKLTSHPQPRPKLTFVAEYKNQDLGFFGQHLSCFDGGNFILAGQVLNKHKYINYGLKLVHGCYATYERTATKIGPEIFGWDAARVPSDQREFFHHNGFYILSPEYKLRPEMIESLYYAYRATGNKKFQDLGWRAFLAISATTRVGSGYSSINNVNAPGGGGFGDLQESFWFAEVLKYSYLLQSPDAEWQVSKNGKNKWVFNTEAHPLRVFSS